MKRIASAFLGMALLLFGHAVWAQAPTAPPVTSQGKPQMTEEEKKDAWTYLVFEEVLQRSCEDPTLASAIALPKPLLNVEVADDNTIVLKGRLGTEMGKQFVASVDVKSPFNSSGETILANQGGLSKGSTLDAKLTWFGWKPREIYNMIQEWDSEKIHATCDDKSPCDAREELKKVVGPSVATEGSMYNFLKKPATSRPSGISVLGEDKYSEVREKYRNWLRKNDPIVPVLTLKGHAGQKDFDFYVPAAGPPAGLKKTSESHQNYHVTGSAGFYILGNVYAALSYSR
ncbi:MAG TPA: hypothetical protein VGM86_04080, partial [Thermoanaerobaculia bacterium]